MHRWRFTILVVALVALLPIVGYADSLSVVISDSHDDAEEMSVNGNVWLVDKDLELVDSTGKMQIVGVRFAGLLIPTGAIIDSAFIDFVVDEPGSGAASVTIQAEASDNASPFTKDRNNITNRPLTSTAAGWSPIPVWTTVGDTVTTPDLSEVVQEIVSRPGWASGNAMVFSYSGSGNRVAKSYDATGPLFAPRLRVYFSNMPDILILKSAQTTSDPVNGTLFPKTIPGADVLYTLVTTNYGKGATDSNSCQVTDAIPFNVMLFVGDLGGGGPILFTDGAIGSELSYTFTSLGSTTDDLSFSNDGGLTFGYVPTPDVDGYDQSLTHIRVTPQGAFAAADDVNFPSFTLRFRVRPQ